MNSDSTPNPQPVPFRNPNSTATRKPFFGIRLLEEIYSDLRFALRQVFKNKMHTAVIVFTLALCLGSNTTAYNFMKNLVTNPYEYEDIESIVQVGKRWAKLHPAVSQLSIPHYFFIKDRCDDILEEIGFVDDDIQFDLDLGSRVRRIHTDLITPEIWRITKVQPLVGRFFTEADVESSSGRNIVLGEKLWNDLRTENDDMIGKEVVLDGKKYNVIGVAPSDFYLNFQRAEAWLPRIFTPKEIQEEWRRNDHSYIALGRLKQGISIEQANEKLHAIYEAFLDKFPEDRDDQERTGATFESANINTAVVANLPQIAVAFRSVQIVTMIVLVIGCLNVSGMILVRSFSRIQEYAMRRALGATVRRLSMQILTEICVYFILGAIFSIFVLQAGYMCASMLQLNEIPWAQRFEIDSSSLRVTFLVAFLCAILTGVIPIISVLKRDLIEFVKSGGRTVSGSAAKHRMHAFFVISQVTLSVVLLVLAGVLIKNLNAVLEKSIGFSREGRLAIEVQQPEYRFGNGWEAYQSNVLPFRERVLEKLRTMPGVVSAACSNRVPMSPYNTSHSDFSMDHYQYAPGEEYANGLRVVVSPGYFETINSKILQSRDFADTDTAETEKVVIIDQKLVDRYYQNVNPIGQTIQFWGQTLKIIGVIEKVQDKPYFIPWQGFTLYFPVKQWDMDRNYTDFIIHVQGDPERFAQSLRRAILEVDPKVTMEVHTFDEAFKLATFAQRLPMVMTLFFACIALLLSGIGLYGLISFTVIERTKEFGIRMALGAKPQMILNRILKGSGRLVGTGMVIGILVAFALCMQLNPILSEVNTLQVDTFVVVTVFVSLICLAASLLPAVKATRINIIETLRYE